MDDRIATLQTPDSAPTAGDRREGWLTPTLQVISLSCEISAYAPDDGDTPLF